VLQVDVGSVYGKAFEGIDLFAAGVPCPPFSIAGKQLGQLDDRDLFPQALRLIRESRPKAVLLENVKGFAAAKFEPYRRELQGELTALGYGSSWQIVNASDFGVPQLRPRFLLVAVHQQLYDQFTWPDAGLEPPTVGERLVDLMASRCWPGAQEWARRANGIAPTIVGGSKKHGGPDLGPTRAREEWKRLGVDGMGIADQPPGPDFPWEGQPRLTTRMVARLQGFPDYWQFFGGKTATHRQIGNAFPPPVAAAIGMRIASVLLGKEIVGGQPRLMEGIAVA
jgi:DNA (cytosine-5)-methyltransferase 1